MLFPLSLTTDSGGDIITNVLDEGKILLPLSRRNVFSSYNQLVHARVAPGQKTKISQEFMNVWTNDERKKNVGNYE